MIDYEEHCRVMKSLGINPASEEEWRGDKDAQEKD